MKSLLSALFGLFATGVFPAQADIDTVIVGGAVRDPGRHTRTAGMTLTQAIGKAGAASDWVRAKLLRDGKANVFSRKSIKKHPRADPKVLRGDYIEVDGEF